jgi:hypothetical protein
MSISSKSEGIDENQVKVADSPRALLKNCEGYLRVSKVTPRSVSSKWHAASSQAGGANVADFA